MDVNDNWSARRANMLVVMLVSMIAATVFSGMVRGFYWDQIIAGALLSFVFFLILMLYLECNRFKKGGYDLNANDYKTITVLFVIGLIITVGSMFLPEYLRPVMIAALLISVSVDLFFSMISCVYFCTMLFIYADLSNNLFLTYLLLSLIGCFVSVIFEEKKNWRWGCLIILTSHVCIPVLLEFIIQQQFHLLHAAISACAAVISIVVCILILPHLKKKHDEIEPDRYTKILEENFVLLKAMKDYSKLEYEHAKKVSSICEECAALVQADERICRTAGLYYRLGRMEGEPHVENGVSLAQTYDFPKEITQILSEYNGEKKLPSTRESAIVHIVNCIVTKFEVLDDTTFSSSWNKEMVIYQTLNEMSVDGLYDSSGLSMNAFLKIREFLMKKGDLS